MADGTLAPRARLNARAEVFADTPPLIEALIKESQYLPAWRPIRAGAIMGAALAQTPKDHVWMTVAEFKTWSAQHFPPGSPRRRLLMGEVGMTTSRQSRLLKGEATPSKVEALACAHYALGLKPPVAAGSPDAFADWVRPRFGQVKAVSRALGLNEAHITDRLRGFDIDHRGRRQRLPDAGLIRAMDWVWRVGPISPYGARIAAAVLPGQGDLP